MLLKKMNGESIYFEYMLKLYLDDKNMYLATGNVAGKEISATITIPNSLSKSIDVVECTGSISSISCEIFNDKDCNFSKILSFYNRGAGLYFRKAELYMVTKTEEKLLYTGLVYNIKPSDYLETKYSLEIADTMSEVYKKPTLMYNSLKKYADWFNEDLNNKPTGNANVVVTKYKNSEDKIEIKLAGHPLDVARFLLTNMYKDYVAYDDVTFDTAKLETLVPILNKCEFIFTELVKDTLDYMTKNIFRVCNCYPYLDRSGKICVKVQRQLTVLQDTRIFRIDRSKIVNFNSKNMDFSKVINHVMTVRGKTEIKDYFFDGDSYLKFKKFIPEDVKEITINRGTMTDTNVVEAGQEVATKLFTLFGKTYQEYSLELELSEFETMNVGDTLALTHELLIDGDSGNRGYVETALTPSLYAIMDKDTWGDYSSELEILTYLENFVEVNYNVTKLVSNLWYNTVIRANDKNKEYSDFLRG